MLHFGELQEIPELAQLIQAQASEAGFTSSSPARASTRSTAPSGARPTGDPPCVASAELGIVDYGHRATPDVYLNAAPLDRRDLELLAVLLPGVRCRLRRILGGHRRRSAAAACKTIQEILLEDSPVLVPYFYNYISGFSNKFTGVRVSALGQMFLDQAATV